MTDPNHDLPATQAAKPLADEAVMTKRAAARRQFMRQGAIAGTGVVVYTIHHKRSFAGSKKLLVSSVEACNSLGGTIGKEKKVVDSINPVYDKHGKPEKTAIRYECEVKDPKI